MSLWLQVILALVLPVTWGIGSAWAYDQVAHWLKNRKRTS